MALTFAQVLALTLGEPFITRETVALETPACRAMSRIVVLELLFNVGSSPRSHHPSIRILARVELVWPFDSTVTRKR